MIVDVDELQLYFGDDYFINDLIKIHQPTIGEIVDFGESDYFSVVHTITAIPSDMKSRLWDLGLDWTEVSDYELFMMMSGTLSVDRTSILFGDLDFSSLIPCRNPQNGDIVLFNKETGVIIDKLIYLRIVNYLRRAHGITPKIERAANELTKKVLIEEDRANVEAAKTKKFKSFLLPLISSVKVRMGYTKDYIRNEGYVEFMDDVKRLQIIHSADHLLSGCYAGTIDLKKINRKEINWMRDPND